MDNLNPLAFLVLMAGIPIMLAILQKLYSDHHINVPRLGKSPGLLGWNLIAAKRDFALHGHEIVEGGYQKHPDTNFLVQTQDMERLVVAPKYLAELRMLPENKLNHATALVEKHLGHFTGVDTILESRQHADVCRLQLTSNLPSLLPMMANELDFAMSEHMKNSGPKGQDIYGAYGFVFTMVLSVSSRVFVGDGLCRDPRWLQIVSSYLAEVVGTAKALRPWPRAIRPLLRPFLAPSSGINRILADARKVLNPAIDERRQSPEQYLDLLRFLVDTSPDSMLNSMPTILKLLVLTSAALHTSTMAAVHALYDLCARPDYFALLRDEVHSAITAENGRWSMKTINRLKILDSFLKESMRYNQPDTLGFNRKVISPIKLSDGRTTIPTGTFLNMPAGPMSRDASFYPEPNDFNPKRFLDPEKVVAGAPSTPLNDFSGIERGNLAWGSGRLTCPGRWYASAMNKLIVGKLLLDYEFEFAGGQTERPPNSFSDGTIMPSVTQELRIRRRMDK